MGVLLLRQQKELMSALMFDQMNGSHSLMSPKKMPSIYKKESARYNLVFIERSISEFIFR